jgi:hypothetical protein
MARRRAQLRESDGYHRSIGRRTAYLLVRIGEFKIVQERAPLIIEQDFCKMFGHEHRKLCGRLVPGVTKKRLNGGFSWGSGTRVRDPIKDSDSVSDKVQWHQD